MKKTHLLPIITLCSSLLLGACTLPFSAKRYSGLQINSEPTAAVYIDDKHVGETNYYDAKIKPDEHIVRLSPLEGSTTPWETKVNLIPGLTTVIARKFSNSTQESSSYVIQLEKITNKKVAELSIVTTPENIIVRIDDQPKGFSPLINIGITPDSHKVTLSAPGYKNEDITINPVLGYRLILSAELGKSLQLQPSLTISESTSSASLSDPIAPASASAIIPLVKPIATPALDKPYVEILPTPTGWLRVRSEPNGLTDNEVAKLDPGTSYPFIESNDTGWYKIEYEKDKQGWVAATYAKLVE